MLYWGFFFCDIISCATDLGATTGVRPAPILHFFPFQSLLLKTLIFAAGAIASQSFTIDRDVHMLLLKRYAPISLAGALADGCPEKLMGNITDHSGGYVDLIQARTPLGMLAAHAQYQRGPIVEVFSPVAPGDESAQPFNISDLGVATTRGTFVSFIPVLISPMLCAKVGDSERAEFRLDGIPGATYEIHTLAGPSADDLYYNYSMRKITADLTRPSFDVDSLAAIVLPATDAIQRINVRYANGRTEFLTMLDLKFINSENNPIETKQVTYMNGQRYTVDGLSLLSQYVVLPIEDVVHIDFETDGSVIDFLQVQKRHRGVDYK